MELHLNAEVLSGVLSALLLLLFVAIWAWAYSARRRPGYEAAARLPLEEDPEQGDAP